MEENIGYFIAVWFRLFLWYSLLLFMLSFMYRLFCRLWDCLFDLINTLSRSPINWRIKKYKKVIRK